MVCAYHLLQCHPCLCSYFLPPFVSDGLQTSCQVQNYSGVSISNGLELDRSSPMYEYYGFVSCPTLGANSHTTHFSKPTTQLRLPSRTPTNSYVHALA